MTPINEIPAVCNYGTSAVYSDYPNDEQLRKGVIPLDSLPAAWWNKMWCASNCAINEARDMVGQLITEINSVLAQAGVCPAAACTDQLYQSINLIRQRLATASVAGSVLSSNEASKVAVAVDGTMSVNCLGNAASLTTSASTIVGAINELKSTYDTCFSNTATAIDGKAPTSHASSATTYGVGNANNYGHLKISDTYTSVLAACSGVAASQKALACVYAVAAAAAEGNVSLGNTAGCALGTASAGTAVTAARSDHVHPKPTCVACAGANGSGTAFGSAATKTAGSAVGNVPLVGTALGTTANKIVLTNASGALVPSSSVVGSAAYCAAGCFRASTWTPTCVACAGANGSGTAFGTAATVNTGTAAECIPLVGTALGTTNNNIVVTDANGKLKPSGTTIGSAAGKTAGSAVGNVPLVGAALGTTDGNIIVTNASGALKSSGETVAALKTYIKNQNTLYGMEDISLPSTSSYSAALEVSYDGVLYVTQNEYGVAVRIWTDSSTSFLFNEVWGNNRIGHAFSILFKKGDRLSIEYYGSNPTLKVRYYKDRDYTGR